MLGYQEVGLCSGRGKSRGAEFCSTCAGLFAGKPAPTGTAQLSTTAVGAGLPAKGPQSGP
ncbi:hypothetical protein FCH83_20055 [Pseudomonas putida]|nr:hypothetical protein [Pseudomonas putida]NTZ03034.1 hypothetical protein [Pseudomonas putida]NTZ25286.1 hypothetical protein [Pseudomonas putida]NTZ55511.1 hypothetical protein [Pseudomonas putida]NTZ69012.1 hypothetical protein [Pseudomonas putida]